MSFSVMFDILKKKEKEKIVFVQCGHFYLSVGEDAVLLHEILGLKCTCFKKNMCKVGVPRDSLEKYLVKLKELKYAYIVYDYDKVQNELIKKYFANGKYHYLEEKTINCLKCKGISYYEDDKYLEAVTKLLEKNKRDVKYWWNKEMKDGK